VEDIELLVRYACHKRDEVGLGSQNTEVEVSLEEFPNYGHVRTIETACMQVPYIRIEWQWEVSCHS
jgi:hypothetical protein